MSRLQQEAKNSWSEHFRGDFEKTMEILGIKVRHVSQSQMYRSGAYANNILLALEKRHEIQNIIGKYQSKKAQPAESPREYYPYVVYCTRCKKDLTQIEDFSGSELSYSCKCGHSETIGIGEFNNGKLPWKVDWPMRWMYESVDFEPGGVDHCSPGSASLSASSDIANQIFNWTPPLTVMYSFVGVQGHAKMSSSTGNVLTPMMRYRLWSQPFCGGCMPAENPTNHSRSGLTRAYKGYMTNGTVYRMTLRGVNWHLLILAQCQQPVKDSMHRRFSFLSEHWFR